MIKIIVTLEYEFSEEALALLIRAGNGGLHTGFKEFSSITNDPLFKEISHYLEDTDQNFYYAVYAPTWLGKEIIKAYDLQK